MLGSGGFYPAHESGDFSRPERSRDMPASFASDMDLGIALASWSQPHDIMRDRSKGANRG